MCTHPIFGLVPVGRAQKAIVRSLESALPMGSATPVATADNDTCDGQSLRYAQRGSHRSTLHADDEADAAVAQYCATTPSAPAQLDAAILEVVYNQCS